MQFSFLGLDFEITRTAPHPSVVQGAFKAVSESPIAVEAGDASLPQQMPAGVFMKDPTEQPAAACGEPLALPDPSAQPEMPVEKSGRTTTTPGVSLEVLHVLVRQPSFEVKEFVGHALIGTPFTKDQIGKAIGYFQRVHWAVVSPDKKHISITDLGRAREQDPRKIACGGCKPRQQGVKP